MNIPPSPPPVISDIRPSLASNNHVAPPLLNVFVIWSQGRTPLSRQKWQHQFTSKFILSYCTQVNYCLVVNAEARTALLLKTEMKTLSPLFQDVIVASTEATVAIDETMTSSLLRFNKKRFKTR